MGDFRREMDEMIEQMFGGENGGASDVFMPQTNLAETDKAYEVTLDLPGMKPEEVNVELHNNQLWITGERKQESEEKGKTFHRVERRYGRFQRVIPLAGDVNADDVHADYKDGVLHVNIPKVETARPKRIEVSA
jgi:HSP20 family protein